jgi:hypothetical protein
MARGAAAEPVGAHPDDVRTVALRHGLVLAAWLSAFGALEVHLALLAVPVAAVAVLPAARREELVLAALDRWQGVLSDLLAVLAAGAVGSAAGDALRPVVAWAIPAIAGYRTLSLRIPERVLAPATLALVAAAWGTGRMPAVGDGALAALITLAVPAILSLLPRPSR